MSKFHLKKRHFGSLATVLAAALLAGSVSAAPKLDEAGLAALDASLPGDLVNDPRALIDLSQNMGDAKKMVVKSATIPGGGAALQVQVDKPTAEGWRISAGTALNKEIGRGEVVTVGFYARALPNKNGLAAGKISIRVQQNVSPWSGFLDNSIEIGPDWLWYEKAGVATVAMAAGTSSLTMSLGGQAQIVQIGQIIVVKGANSIAAATKPKIPMPPALEKVAGKLINHPEAGPWNFYGTGGSKERVDDKNIFMGKATRVTVPNADGKPWELAMSVPVEGAIKAGDRLLVGILAKTVSAASPDGKAKVGVRFQSIKPPYDGFADNAIQPGAAWQLLQMRTTATRDIADGEAVFTMMFAGQQQVVDIGPVYVMKLD